MRIDEALFSVLSLLLAFLNILLLVALLFHQTALSDAIRNVCN